MSVGASVAFGAFFREGNTNIGSIRATTSFGSFMRFATALSMPNVSRSWGLYSP